MSADPWCTVPGCWEWAVSDGLCWAHDKARAGRMHGDDGHSDTYTALLVAAGALLIVASFLPRAGQMIAVLVAIVCCVGRFVLIARDHDRDLDAERRRYMHHRMDIAAARRLPRDEQIDLMAQAREWDQ